MIFYRKLDILAAALAAFESCNSNIGYADGKTLLFLKRCEADMEQPLSEAVGEDVVQRVCYAMMDVDVERTFWSKLAYAGQK